jgi:hypothetical protein
MKPPKYRNRRTTVDGITFDSAKEARRWGELKLLQRAGEITDLERQVAFPLMVNGHKIGRFTADFVYRKPDGSRVIEDAKGYRTRDFILRAKLMAALHGEVTEV